MPRKYLVAFELHSIDRISSWLLRVLGTSKNPTELQLDGHRHHESLVCI